MMALFMADKSAKISASGQTCDRRRKTGLFTPRSREEQAHYVYHENERFREVLRENKEKTEQSVTSDTSPFFGLSDKTWTCGLYHPNRLIYLFLAVFAFSSPFCYAKTAFPYSRALLSPCTPVLFMVKDVVKSEYRMIDMWSCFQAVNTL